VVPYPRANFTADRNSAPFDDRLIQFFDASTGATRFVWYFDDTASGAANTDTSANPRHFFSTSGFFTIALFVENQLGCSDLAIKSDFITILAEQFYFPTAFTPNGDNLNDRFRPLPLGSAQLQKLEIVDRWGKVVYETDDPNGWNGETKDGNPFDPGTYQYRAWINLLTSGVQLYTGYVTLIR
jgi:gliding motility-associated-like protein